MIANRANFRSFRAYYDMTAISAFPNLDLALFEYLRCFNVVEQCAISFFVVFFNLANGSELSSQFREAFLFRVPSTIFSG